MKIFAVDLCFSLCYKRRRKAINRTAKRHRKTECTEHSVKGCNVFIVGFLVRNNLLYKIKRTQDFLSGSFYSCLVRIKGLGVLHAAPTNSHTGLFGLLYFLFCFYFFKSKQVGSRRLSPPSSPFIFSCSRKNKKTADLPSFCFWCG